MKLLSRFLALAALSLSTYACQSELLPSPAAIPTPSLVANATTAGFPETFESGAKTAYAAGAVTLGSGAWTFDDALLGASTADAKTGAQSARLRNLGSLTMNFDVPTGAATVSVAHAAYGSDGSSQWQLWASAGGAYAQVGSTVTSSSASLQTVSFAAL